MAPPGGPHGANDPFTGLSGRYRRILALLVREYIERGEPVSSLWLAEHAGMQVSSATVRNILARLEEEGFVHQPHTSAGRIPTDLGYRTYVDFLLQTRKPTRPTPEVEARLRSAGGADDVLSHVSHEISRAAHLLGFALAPPDAGITLRHIDFVALDASRVLVVLVSTDGRLWHKVVEPGEGVSPGELTQAANYLNGQFAGRDLSTIRREVLARLHEDRALYDTLLARALRLASGALDDLAPEGRLFVHGTPALIEDATVEGEAIPLATLRSVLAMIEEKHRLVRLLTEYIEGPGVTVVIGAEHTAPDLKNFSLVASTWEAGGHTTTVGVIGPRRMRYSRALSAVDSVGQAAGRVLGNPDEA